MKLKYLTPAKLSKLDIVHLYTIIYIPEGKGAFQIDSGTYSYQAPTVFFLTPFQEIQLNDVSAQKITLLQFHGDFYCIEYHKAEVACNGLLFNNIYLTPHLNLSAEEASTLEEVFAKIEPELELRDEEDKSVLTTYLQLLLAISSRFKKKRLKIQKIQKIKDKKMETFQQLIEENFLVLHKPSEYAALLKITGNVLTKSCKKAFGKKPSNLIQERLILEAKKKLHLTRQSVKEVAFALNFKDEHYFSRFFKKAVGVSPQKFRQQAGISIMADLSS